ncbi:hypothetical protein [Singulisphaera acidiphila]|uniref:DUF1444 family protein n=1 Tax=Singulisphaera acidiphila (strain ATCC BAA-1392 / DSM 18658 / VKM B-2454 / MOB10) TaxID=886293 RepID=L0DI94_SINAD|nr:hypothetical protein [Singulisphaera acidiphila]AGA28580.1 hypothetical protein Sinac_4389 [Singulisphaera acidiphila DSM 18658]
MKRSAALRILDRFFGPPSEARFARQLADAIRRAGETNPIQFDAREFRLVSAGESANVMNLGNLYGEYRSASRGRRPDILHAFVRSWFDRYKEIPELYEDLGPDLLPTIRPRMFHESGRLEAMIAGAPPLTVPHRVVGEHYAGGLVYDLPQSMILVQGRHLEAWETDFDEAFEVACDNLREISRHRWRTPAPGVMASPWGDHYDASRLLILTDLIDRDDVYGDLVAMIPNRDTLLLTSSGDDAGLAALASLAEETLLKPRPLHGYPLCLRDDDWVPFFPEPDHPCAGPFRRLRMKSLARDYAEQASLLNELYRQTGDDAFLAGFNAMENPRTGEAMSYSVWAEGVSTLLPETDRIFFFRPGGPQNGEVVASGDWDRVTEVAGHLLTPLGAYPERYRVEDFPTHAQLAEISDGSGSS